MVSLFFLIRLLSAVESKTKENLPPAAYNSHISLIFLRGEFFYCFCWLSFNHPEESLRNGELFLLNPSMCWLQLQSFTTGSGDGTMIVGKGWKRFFITNLIFWLIFLKHFSMSYNFLSPKLTGGTTRPLFLDTRSGKHIWITHLDTKPCERRALASFLFSGRISRLSARELLCVINTI